MRKWPEATTRELFRVVALLELDKPLEANKRDHALKGGWRGWQDCRECHVFPDILVVYRKRGDTLELIAFDTHSELFG